MKFTLEIELGSNGVEDYHDLAFRLTLVADELKEMYAADRKFATTDGDVVRDADGETVGGFSITDPRYTIAPNDTKCPSFEVNGAQHKALQRKYAQNADGAASFAEFKGRACMSFGTLMLPWCGMWLGIETDGYTHS